MPYQDLDSPEQNSAGNINTPRSSDPRDERSNINVNLPSNKNLSSVVSPTEVSRSRVTSSSEGLNPVRGETESAYLNRQRQTTGNQNLQLSNDAINRAISGREHVWDGNNFVDINSATLDPRGRNQIPNQQVPPTELPDQPAEQSMTASSNIGYGAGQIDPALAQAAKIQGVDVGFGEGQVDPALAKAAGLIDGPVPISSPSSTELGNITAPTAPAGGSSGGGGGTSSGSAPSGVATPTSFNDRYDFLTRQKVREGKHGGQGGGAGTSQPCGAAPGAGGGGSNGTGSGTPVNQSNTGTQSDPLDAFGGAGPDVDTGSSSTSDPLDAFGGAGPGINDDFTRQNEGNAEVEQRLGIDPRGLNQRGSNPKPLPRPENQQNNDAGISSNPFGSNFA